MKYINKHRIGWLARLLRLKNPKIKIKLRPSDTWSIDYAVAPLLLALMKQFKAATVSIAAIENEDAPEELRSDEAYSNERYNWFLDEVIWALEQTLIDWEDQYYTGDPDIEFQDNADGTVEIVHKDTNFKVDYEGVEAHQNRMQNAMMLFGKYFYTLWS